MAFFKALAFTEVFAISNKSIKKPFRAPLKLTNLSKRVKLIISTKLMGKKIENKKGQVGSTGSMTYPPLSSASLTRRRPKIGLKVSRFSYKSSKLVNNLIFPNWIFYLALLIKYLNRASAPTTAPTRRHFKIAIKTLF